MAQSTISVTSFAREKVENYPKGRDEKYSIMYAIPGHAFSLLVLGFIQIRLAIKMQKGNKWTDIYKEFLSNLLY